MPRLSPRTRMARRTRLHARGRLGGDITPMIDVVFLLLIFFICTMDFRQLENKLAAHMPPDRGQNDHFEDLRPVEELRVHLAMSGQRCYCRVNGRSVGTMPDGRTAVFARAREMRDADPKTEAIISVDPAVPHKHVVSIVDECARAELAQIKFAGALPALARR